MLYDFLEAVFMSCKVFAYIFICFSVFVTFCRLCGEKEGKRELIKPYQAYIIIIAGLIGAAQIVSYNFDEIRKEVCSLCVPARILFYASTATLLILIIGIVIAYFSDVNGD